MDFSDHKTLIILLVIILVLVAIIYKYRSSLMGMLGKSSGNGYYTNGLGSQPLNTFGGSRFNIADGLGTYNTLNIPVNGYGRQDDSDSDDDEYDDFNAFGEGATPRPFTLFVDDTTMKAIMAGKVDSVIVASGSPAFTERIIDNNGKVAIIKAHGNKQATEVTVTKVNDTKSSDIDKVVESHKDVKFNAYSKVSEFVNAFKSRPSSQKKEDAPKPNLVVVTFTKK
jgi:hypothetical protein